MRIIVGITGASGALYAIETLRQLREHGHETFCVASDYGLLVLRHECGVSASRLASLADHVYPCEDLTAPIASGSFRCDAMCVVPCSMRTLAAISSGLAGNLICRAADVMLKERKNLVIVARETPVNAIHLENMLRLARLGVSIMPACPGFYHKPETIQEMAAMMVSRILDSLGVENANAKRWSGMAFDGE